MSRGEVDVHHAAKYVPGLGSKNLKEDFMKDGVFAFLTDQWQCVQAKNSKTLTVDSFMVSSVHIRMSLVAHPNQNHIEKWILGCSTA